jgi:hypothetical protein
LKAQFAEFNDWFDHFLEISAFEDLAGVQKRFRVPIRNKN